MRSLSGLACLKRYRRADRAFFAPCTTISRTGASFVSERYTATSISRDCCTSPAKCPTFSIASHRPNGSANSLGLNTRNTTTSVGVALNLPLFAGFAVQNRIQETLAREEQAEADLEALRRNVAQATRAAYFGVQSGHSQVSALQAAEASSQSALDANQLGYKVGVRINIDVLNAQSQLYETKRDLAVARYNLLLGQLKLRQAAGVLSLDDLRALDALLARP